MKKKSQAPHDEIKAYLKTCKERIDQAFFTRPEWRHPKTAAGVNVIISRLNEVYYPFADRKKPKSAVWKQVLREKREEMIGEIEDSIKAKEKTKNENIDQGIIASEKLDKKSPRPGSCYELPATLLPVETWTKERIAKLKADIKRWRIGSEIARRLEVHISYIGYILSKGTKKSQANWLPKIQNVFNDLAKPVLDVKCDTSEAEKSVAEAKNDVNHKNFMGMKYPQGVAKSDVPMIEKPERNPIGDILELAEKIYRMIEGGGFGRTSNQKRQILNIVAQLIDPNLVFTRQP